MKDIPLFRIVLIVGLLLLSTISCAKRRPALTDFSFITANTTLDDVEKKMGPSDKSKGSGVVWFGYDLADGSTVWITPCFIKTDPLGQLYVSVEKHGVIHTIFPKGVRVKENEQTEQQIEAIGNLRSP